MAIQIHGSCYTEAEWDGTGRGETGILFATQSVARIKTPNAKGEAMKKQQEIDISICNIFPRINHDRYMRVEKWAVLLETQVTSLDCAVSSACVSLPIRRLHKLYYLGAVVSLPWFNYVIDLSKTYHSLCTMSLKMASI